MKNLVWLSLLLLAGCAADGHNSGAVVGSAAGAAAGSVIGKQTGGDNGSVLGAAIGAAAGAAIGGQSDPQAQSATTRPATAREYDGGDERHDRGRHKGERKRDRDEGDD